jgi:hypothetical protein
MYAQMFHGSPLRVFPLFALVLFATAFAVLVTRVIRAGGRRYDPLAELPLGDDEVAVHSDREGAQS